MASYSASPDSMMAPGDFDVQSAAIARKRKLIEAMLTKTKLGEGKMVGGQYIAPHWTEAIAELGSAYMAKKRNADLDKEEAGLHASERAGLGEAVQQYLKTKNGYDEQVATPGPTLDGSALPDHTESTKADPRTAMIEAMTSRYKPMHEIGKLDMTAMTKADSSLTAKDLLSLNDYTPESRRAAVATKDPSLLVPVAGKAHVINGRLVRETEDGSEEIGNFADKFGNVGQIGTDPTTSRPILGQLEKTSNKASFVPAGGATVNVDTGKKAADAFGTAGADLVMKNLGEGATAAKKAQQSFEIFKNARSLINDVPGGTGADFILSAKKLAQQLGVKMDNSITSTEQVGAALGQAVLDNSKALGTGNGFTDKDRDFLEKIVMGKLSLDPQSLKRAVNLGMTSNLNAMRDHERKLKKAAAIRGADPAILDQLAVEVPGFSLDGGEFNYDEKTGRFGVNSTTPNVPNPSLPIPGAQQTPGLAPDEHAELLRLRTKYGRN